jgi:hypothetical protein
MNSSARAALAVARKFSKMGRLAEFSIAGRSMRDVITTTSLSNPPRSLVITEERFNTFLSSSATSKAEIASMIAEVVIGRMW